LALPGAGLVEAALGLARCIWAMAGVAQGLPTGVAGSMDRYMPIGR
jgi:hypothetical protein